MQRPVWWPGLRNSPTVTHASVPSESSKARCRCGSLRARSRKIRQNHKYLNLTLRAVTIGGYGAKNEELVPHMAVWYRAAQPRNWRSLGCSVAVRQKRSSQRCVTAKFLIIRVYPVCVSSANSSHAVLSASPSISCLVARQ
jgi:hypothetical protein